MRRLKYDTKLAAKKSKREIRNVIIWETTNLTKVQLFLQLSYLLLTFFHIFVLYKKKKKKKKSKLQMKYYFNATLTLNDFVRTNGTRVNA